MYIHGYLYMGVYDEESPKMACKIGSMNHELANISSIAMFYVAFNYSSWGL